MDKLKLRIGIMASSSFHMGPVGIVGAIPLAIAYYNTSPTIMQTIFALPALTAVPMSLIIGSLAGRTGKKIPLQTGILAMIISGLAVAIFDLPLSGLIAAMAVMGLGLGCLMTFKYRAHCRAFPWNRTKQGYGTSIFAMLNISAFAAPATVNTLARVTASETAQVCFNIGAVLMALLCVFSYIYGSSSEQ